MAHPPISDQLTAFFEKATGNPQVIRQRDDLLNQLQCVLRDWVCSKRDDGKDCAQMMVFGGHYIDPSVQASDLDLLCVVPQWITLDQFFTEFPEQLKSMEGCTQLRVVTGAYVPIIETTINGIQVDLSLSVINMDTVPPDLDWMSDEVLKYMDEKSIRAIKGVRDSKCILSLVPNHTIFRELLKVVKCWAKAQCIYGSGAGYPGGVAWTIMVAKICQLNPTENHVLSLLHKFFYTFSTWNWSKPVLLKPLEDDKLKLGSWNAKAHSSDRSHLMPVIAPGYPERNATFTVSKASLNIFQRACTMAQEKVSELLRGKCELHDFVTPQPFHKRYKHYLFCTAKVSKEANLNDWSGLVASQLRKLVVALEDKEEIDVLHLNPESYSLGNPLQRHWLIGMAFVKGVTVNMDIASAVQDLSSLLQTLAKERALYKPGMEIEVHYQARKDLKTMGL